MSFQDKFTSVKSISKRRAVISTGANQWQPSFLLVGVFSLFFFSIPWYFISSLWFYSKNRLQPQPWLQIDTVLEYWRFPSSAQLHHSVCRDISMGAAAFLVQDSAADVGITSLLCSFQMLLSRGKRSRTPHCPCQFANTYIRFPWMSMKKLIPCQGLVALLKKKKVHMYREAIPSLLCTGTSSNTAALYTHLDLSQPFQ